jgi:hypothetical protein
LRRGILALIIAAHCDTFEFAAARHSLCSCGAHLRAQRSKQWFDVERKKVGQHYAKNSINYCLVISGDYLLRRSI